MPAGPASTTAAANFIPRDAAALVRAAGHVSAQTQRGRGKDSPSCWTACAAAAPDCDVDETPVTGGGGGVGERGEGGDRAPAAFRTTLTIGGKTHTEGARGG